MQVRRGFVRRAKGIACRQSGLFAVGVRRRLPNRNGFTLIELLVVIGVIALLIAILVPVLRKARNQARTVVCQSNLNQWGQIMNLYTEENEGCLPRSFPRTYLLILRGPFQNNGNRGLSDYAPISTEGIACCPMAATGPAESARKRSWGLSLKDGEHWEGESIHGDTFRAWEMTGMGPPFRCSYGFNSYFLSYRWEISKSYGTVYGFNTHLVKGRAGIPAFLDSALPKDYPSNSSASPPDWDRYDDLCDMRAFCLNRHNGYINGMFLDWSVRKIGLKELWTLNWNREFDRAGRWTKAGGVQPEDWPDWMRRFKDY